MISTPRDQLVTFSRRLTTLRRPLLISHAKPDGDALGSLLGLRELLAALSIEATPLIFDALPHRYHWLNGVLKRLDVNVSKQDLNRFDSVIMVDTCTYNQLEPVADWLRAANLPKYVIDHHQTRDDLADHYLIDSSAAAACLILYDLAITCGWPISLPAAQALFVGIATDTGWFRHSNTDARALSAAADLVNRGVIPNQIFDRIYNSDRAPRLRLLGKAIDSLELHDLPGTTGPGAPGPASALGPANTPGTPGEQVEDPSSLAKGGSRGVEAIHAKCSTSGPPSALSPANARSIAIMTLPSQAFTTVGAEPSDTEDLVNEPMRIESVVVSVLLVEHEGVIRVNLRSRAPANPSDPDIDVSAIAATLGGGGHRRAAGVRLKTSLAQAKTQVLTAIHPTFAT